MKTRIVLAVVFTLGLTQVTYAAQPKPNTCQLDEVGASEITCKGYVKLLEDTAGNDTGALQIAESRMWKAAFKFCEGIEKTHEVRNVEPTWVFRPLGTSVAPHLRGSQKLVRNRC